MILYACLLRYAALAVVLVVTLMAGAALGDMTLLGGEASTLILCEGAMMSAKPIGLLDAQNALTHPGEPIDQHQIGMIVDPAGAAVGSVECATHVEVFPERAFVAAIAGIEAESGWGRGEATSSTSFSFRPTVSLFAARVEGMTDTSLGRISINIQNSTTGATLLDWTGASIDETFIWLLNPADTYMVSMNAESRVSGGNACVESRVGLTCEVETVPLPGATLLGIIGLSVAGCRLRRRLVAPVRSSGLPNARLVLTLVVVSLFAANTGRAGYIWSWGRDDLGQVSDTPEGGDFIEVAGGNMGSIALRSDGTIVSWGSNFGGMVSNTPSGNDFADIAAGTSHYLALRSDGSIAAWGNDSFGEVGNTPTGSDFVDIAAGSWWSVALKSDGSLVSWGNPNGAGNIPAGSDFTAVTAGDHFGVALRSDGSLSSWGFNSNEQYGMPTNGDFVDVTTGSYHSVALESDNSLTSWGFDGNGQVSNTPAGDNFVDIGAGDWHSLALSASGSIESWGLDNWGQVSDTPVEDDFVEVAGGGFHSLALTTEPVPEVYGLFLGIRDSHTWKEYRGDQDAERLYETLSSNLANFRGTREESVLTADYGAGGIENDEIIDALNAMKSKIGPEDTFIFYAGGHGSDWSSGTETTSTPGDEWLLLGDYLEDDHLTQLLSDMDCEKWVFLVLQRYKGSRKAKQPADDPMDMAFLLGGPRYGCQYDYEAQAGIDTFSAPVRSLLRPGQQPTLSRPVCGGAVERSAA